MLEEEGLFQECLGHLASSKDSTGIPSSTAFFSQPALNSFAALTPTTRTAVRHKIISLLSEPTSPIFASPVLNNAAFHLQKDVKMHLPMQIGDFTDFMCARTHVNNCSRIAGAPGVPPNFYAFPTAYNGRSSSIVPSGTPIQRPKGMLRLPDQPTKFEFAPSKMMDFELEMGFFVSKPVPFGKIIRKVKDAREHIFGFVMLNDWSARDVQFAEMTPLGPFNGKGSGTTISPWIITLDALEGAEIACGDELAVEKMGALPQHLRHEDENYTWNVEVSVSLKRAGDGKGFLISKSNLKDLYWSPAQMLSHHASSGCGLRTGDLLGTGTISSLLTDEPAVSPLGCLHEMTAAGTIPFKTIGNSEVRWLEDGDDVLLSGNVLKADGSRVGFGDCYGVLIAS